MDVSYCAKLFWICDLDIYNFDLCLLLDILLFKILFFLHVINNKEYFCNNACCIKWTKVNIKNRFLKKFYKISWFDIFCLFRNVYIAD